MAKPRGLEAMALGAAPKLLGQRSFKGVDDVYCCPGTEGEISTLRIC